MYVCSMYSLTIILEKRNQKYSDVSWHKDWAVEKVTNILFFFVIECLSKAEIIELIRNDCLDNPCQNGHCIDLKNDYRCECEPGYGGKNCDLYCPLDNGQYRIVDGICLR